MVVRRIISFDPVIVQRRGSLTVGGNPLPFIASQVAQGK